MGDVWDSFISGFCEVEFAFYQGDTKLIDWRMT